MIVWTKRMKDAPKDKMIMVRHKDWDCPAFMGYFTHDNRSWWGFIDREIPFEKSLDDNIMDEVEWAKVPL